MKYIIYLVLGLVSYLLRVINSWRRYQTGTLTDEAQVTSNPGGYALATGAYRTLVNLTAGGNNWEWIVWYVPNLHQAKLIRNTREQNFGNSKTNVEKWWQWLFVQHGMTGIAASGCKPWHLKNAPRSNGIVRNGKIEINRRSSHSSGILLFSACQEVWWCSL